MKVHLADGLSAAEAARAAIAESQAQPASETVTDPPASASATDLVELSNEWQRALDDFDEPAAHAALDRLLSEFSVATALRDVVLPYLHLLGERWTRGDVTIAQEHFASNVIRGRLAGLARGWGSGHGPKAILACPPGELHDLSLMVFGIILNRHGWRIQYLGADTPADELLHAAGRSLPDLVVVAATTTDRFDAIHAELAELAKVAPLAVAGAGATRRIADDAGARLAERRSRHGCAERAAPMSPARVGRRPVVLWFRRDLRLSDHPALAEAAKHGPITALFVLDDVLLRPAGEPRLAYLLRTLRALEQQLRAQGGALTVRAGRPEHVVPAVAEEAKATAVHITADFAPYGTARDQRVAAALGAVPLLATGSPYAVAPGQLMKADGRPYQVFTPFYRAWLAHGWERPACLDLDSIEWCSLDGMPLPGDPTISVTLPDAGEPAACAAWDAVRRTRLATYASARDHPALDATSRLSPFLKLGALHPRTLLADLGSHDEAFRRQLAWREFYAAVLSHWPSTARSCFQPQMGGMQYDGGREADTRFAAWATGRTGYPLVDAGMRQLLREGWMHNRLRMITASFLVKDLHIDWTRGARHFMHHLIDGDLASNQHGWQWVAGSGTDAAPYFRIFNPVSQGRKFDPDGDFIRRWVRELSHLPSTEIHEPWRRSVGLPSGYPARIVEHSEERAESLARYHALRARRRTIDLFSARP